MARYDRIAPIKAPSRDEAFPAWAVLRDLEESERDADLGRRARLRYLALRPVRRLLDRGIENVPVDSYERQIEGVREELGHLSARDPERTRLSEFLHRIRQRSPTTLITATIDMGEVAEAAGHYFAAEEYYQTALDIAVAFRLPTEQVLALRILGRVSRKTTRWDAAIGYYERAIELAERMDDREQWARATDGLSFCYRYQGNYPEARRISEQLLARGREIQNPFMIATASNGLCVNELTAGNLEQALAHGWTAVEMMPDEDERNPILGNIGMAFTGLGMYTAAERCYAIIASRSSQIITRTQARADMATVAAIAGRFDDFRNRRAELLADAAEWDGEPWITAWVNLTLGQGSVLAGDVDFARDHLRAALGAARKHGYNEVLIRAEDVLATLEEAAAGRKAEPPAPIAEPGSVAQRIAGEVEAYGKALATA